MEVAIAVTGVGLIIFLAHFFSTLFEHTRVPDVLPLVLIGLLIGPISGLASIQHFGQVGPVFANVTLVIILFESGLNIKISDLRPALGRAAFLGLMGFGLSTLMVTASALYLLKLPLESAVVLGTILGGTAASIAIPLLRRLKLNNRTRTILTLESVLGNVLSIVISLALMTAIEHARFHPHVIVGKVLIAFLMASLVGLAFGYLWAHALSHVRTLTNTKFTTPACVCICYGVAEIFGYSGIVAALAFGIVMGNADGLLAERFSIRALRPIAVNNDERAIIGELVFLLKTFFFVYLGISIEWMGMELLYAGAVIVLWLFIVRPLVILVALDPKVTTPNDATVASVMIPRGLASAVLASLAVSRGLPESIIVSNLAYSVILLSVVATATMSFISERGWLKTPFNFIFMGFLNEDSSPVAVTTDKGAPAEAETEETADHQKVLEEFQPVGEKIL